MITPSSAQLAIAPALTAEMAASVFHYSRDAIMITALDGTIIAVNHAFSVITGYTDAEVRGCNPRMLKSGRQDAAFYSAMWKTIASLGYWEGEAWNKRKDGSLFAARISISTVPGADGRPHHYIAVFADITGASNQRPLLEQRANYDALTGLPNRLLLGERLEQLLSSAHRDGAAFALAFIDVDDFKQVNDTLGHAAGDALLATLAQRMRHALRDSDMLARFGGDEFIAVLSEMSNPVLLAALTARITEAARAPVMLEGCTICPSASIGIALFPRDGSTAAQLIRCADTAMYAQKRGRRQDTFPSEHVAMTPAHAQPARNRAGAT